MGYPGKDYPGALDLFRELYKETGEVSEANTRCWRSLINSDGNL
jgi:hypothetical protein